MNKKDYPLECPMCKCVELTFTQVTDSNPWDSCECDWCGHRWNNEVKVVELLPDHALMLALSRTR